MFGGVSAVWGGFCAMLEERAFRAGRWPIAFEELARFYPEAASVLDLPESAWKMPSVPIDGTDELVYRPFYLSPPVRFGQRFLGEIRDSNQISLLLAHTLTRIQSHDERALTLLVADAAGEILEIRAEHVVLAAGGIQNARLLRLSGLGNDNAGRHLMEHPHLIGYGKIMLGTPVIDASRKTSGRRVDALQLSDELCQDLGLLSFSVGIDEARDANGLPSAEGGMLRAGVTVRAEMDPVSENRVSLSAELDALGQPLADIRFRFAYDDLFRKSWLQFGESLLRSGLGRVTSYREPLVITGGGHMIGTTRMGLSANDSVVNGDCRVHGLRNLYMAGSSVFPAGGAANPTFSIVALALRLAEHLDQQLSK